MELRILGPLEAWDGDAPVGLGPHKQQAMLARLLLDAGRVVSVDRLVADLWGERAPETAVKMIHVYVSQLRKALPSAMLATRRPGYVVELGGHALDLHRFAALRREGADALARGDAATASERLHAALELWRGEPLAEFEEPFALPERATLEAAHLTCLEDRIEADLALGRHAELVDELESLLARNPGRERLCGLVMLALYRCGRQGEALAAYAAFRRRLDEDLGIAPSTELRDLQVRILRQDPGLEPAARVAAAPPPAPRHRHEPQPVGRERELAVLQESLADAVGGRRRIAFITGEAGIGKSTLVESLLEAAEAQPGVLAALGQCVEHHGPGEAYLPMFDALARLARGPAGAEVASLLEQRAPTWLVQMPWLAARADRVLLETRVLGATPDRLLREMLEFVDALAATRPVVLVLEDLHWSDLSTVDLVTALARRQQEARLLLVVTYRPADARAAGHSLDRAARELRLRGHAIELGLEPLSEQAVRAYLESRGVLGVPDGVVTALRARTHGNPLFIEKVVEEVADGGPEALLERVPDTLKELIEQQLQALGEEEQRVLEAAGVTGVEAAAAAVAAGCERDEEEVEEALDALARRGAFVEDLGEETWPDGTLTHRYRFTHDVCQQILWDRPQPARRARLHRRIGTRLEQAYGERAGEISAQLASHFVEGRDPVRAVHHLQRAAEQAFHRAAPRDALEHVRTGLEVADGLPEELRTRAELPLRSIQAPALVAVHGFGHEEAERTFLRVRELCEALGPPEDLQRALFQLAVFYEARAQFVRTEAILSETLAFPDAPEYVEVRIDSHELMACTLFHQSAFSRSVEHAEHLLELWDGTYCNPLTAANGDNPGSAAHGWAALSLWFLGKADQARARALEGVALAQHPRRVPGQATAFAQAALAAHLRREPGRTLELAEHTIDVSRVGGYPFREATGRVLRGWALAHLDAADEGLSDIREGMATVNATGVRMDDVCFLGILADACLRAGRIAEGLDAIDQARIMQRTDRTYFYVPELHRLEGELRARAGTAGVIACLDRAVDAARERGSPALLLRALVARTRALMADGREDDGGAALAAVRAQLDEGADTADVREADELLAELAPAAH